VTTVNFSILIVLTMNSCRGYCDTNSSNSVGQDFNLQPDHILDLPSIELRTVKSMVNRFRYKNTKVTNNTEPSETAGLFGRVKADQVQIVQVMGETINKLFLADCFDVPVIIIILCEYSPK
jgi:hypothetical protein